MQRYIGRHTLGATGIAAGSSSASQPPGGSVIISGSTSYVYSPAPGWPAQYRAVQRRKVQSSSVQCSAVQCNVALCSALWCVGMARCIAQCAAAHRDVGTGARTQREGTENHRHRQAGAMQRRALVMRARAQSSLRGIVVGLWWLWAGSPIGMTLPLTLTTSIWRQEAATAGDSSVTNSCGRRRSRRGDLQRGLRPACCWAPFAFDHFSQLRAQRPESDG